MSRQRTLTTDGLQTVCVIIDAMDKSKFRFPRSLLMQAKDLQNLQRPTLEMTAALVHGHMLCLCVAKPHVHKDSSAMCEILTHVLHQLAVSGLDLRHCALVVQADNTSRESKNNTMTRHLAALVGARRLGRAELRFLESGHSHEDIDAFFAIVASALESENELHLPASFVTKLASWLRQPQAR